MALPAARGFWSHLRVRARSVRLCLAAVLLLLSPGIAHAQTVKGEASFSASGGFARLLLKLAEDVPVEVTTAGSIVILRFERPVDIPMDRWIEGALDYVSSARRDPDGSAIRLSLARRVRINTMAAGERTFIDFLPDSWTGAPPSLPIEVVRELAERARAAEKALRLQRAEALAKKRPPIRVRALVQPTFVRFVFEMPDGVGASSVLNDGKLNLQFGGLLTLDLADAKIAAPPNVASINQKIEGDSTQVEIALIGDVDVHTFREDKNYIVDVGFQSEKPKESPLAETERAAGAKPPTAPHAAEKPANAERHSEEVKPPAPEMIARGMKETRPVVAAPALVETAKPPPADSEPSRLAAAEGARPIEPPKLEAAKPVAMEEHKLLPAEEPKPATAEAPKPAEMPKPAMETAKPVAPEMPKPVAAEASGTMAAAPAADAKPAESSGAVEVWRDSEGLRLTFSFAMPTPAASFRRGDTVWLVFDSQKTFDLEPVRAKGGAIIGEIAREMLENGQAIRIRLNRPQMHSLTIDERSSGASWTLVFADKVQAPPRPLNVMRNITDPALANVAVPLAGLGLAHRITDPDAGDTLVVVTAPPPLRGFIRRQDFVDFALLDSAHGVAIRPNSDDVRVEVALDKVIIGKPGGLALSPASIAAERAPLAMRPVFDVEEWHKNREERFINRENALIQAAAAAEPEKRTAARLALARFYMARGFYREAKGQTEFMLSDPAPKAEEPMAVMVHAVASILCDRPDLALKDLASPVIGNNYDSQLWKALALARQGKWAEAREKFKNVEFAIASLPLELQRIVTTDAMRAALEVKDYAGAAKRRAEFDVIGLTAGFQPAVAVLRGRLAEALGNDRDALDDYKLAIDSADRKSAAEARQLEVALKQKRNEITPQDALKELETLQAIWRGDSIEVKTLQMLSVIYNENGRYADALMAARTATRLEPNSELSRQAQDLASALFSQVFLTPKGDDLPPIDALGMFFEFRELTPIGRRGDEMIRRLADRLVAVDLLDQAAELLQYQVDKRLEGSARAQVAARLAMVYLANHKPDLAISALRSSRIADLSGELRQQRLLLEARAQSDIGRHDLALDIVSNLGGREAIRLRSDIYWAARRWREASEQIELYYGDRWRDFKPLNPAEKSDVIRAVVGYALAEDAIGLVRFREKYAPLMNGESDKLAFDMASKPAAATSGEFAAIAKMAASVDTLDGFLREMRTRFPDATARAPAADPNPTGSLPKIAGERSVRG
jgi:tetratricopeptide (TPR) repeat protein